MRLIAAAVLLCATCCAIAEQADIWIKRCNIPLWLEVREVGMESRFTLRACGSGDVEAIAGDEAFHARFPYFRVRQLRQGWQVHWSLAEDSQRGLRVSRQRTTVQADRQPVALRVPKLSESEPARNYQLSVWPRIAPNDVQIRANASSDLILRELMRVTGLRIDNIELQQPEPTQINIVSIAPDALLELLVSSAWLLRVGPDHVRLGIARAEGTPQLSSAAFLRLVQPQAESDFPQPAIRLHTELALEARRNANPNQALEHLKAAETLLQPYAAGNRELLLLLHIERAELQAGNAAIISTAVSLPQVNAALDEVDLVLRTLALHARRTNQASIEPALEKLGMRLDALPAALNHVNQLFLHSVRTSSDLTRGDLDSALARQMQIIEGWQHLPFDQTQYEPGLQLHRQLHLNEIVLGTALMNAGRHTAAAERVKVARWLEQHSSEKMNGLRQLEELPQSAHSGETIQISERPDTAHRP